MTKKVKRCAFRVVQPVGSDRQTANESNKAIAFSAPMLTVLPDLPREQKCLVALELNALYPLPRHHLEGESPKQGHMAQEPQPQTA